MVFYDLQNRQDGLRSSKRGDRFDKLLSLGLLLMFLMDNYMKPQKLTLYTPGNRAVPDLTSGRLLKKAGLEDPPFKTPVFKLEETGCNNINGYYRIIKKVVSVEILLPSPGTIAEGSCKPFKSPNS